MNFNSATLGVGVDDNENDVVGIVNDIEEDLVDLMRSLKDCWEM